MLTAFGILGTFIGIVIGLSQIGGQMGGDADQLKGAMGNLIGSLGVSFRTSIWGLILSVVSTIYLQMHAPNSMNKSNVGSSGLKEQCHRRVSQNRC